MNHPQFDRMYNLLTNPSVKNNELSALFAKIQKAPNYILGKKELVLIEQVEKELDDAVEKQLTTTTQTNLPQAAATLVATETLKKIDHDILLQAATGLGSAKQNAHAERVIAAAKIQAQLDDYLAATMVNMDGQQIGIYDALVQFYAELRTSDVTPSGYFQPRNCLDSAQVNGCKNFLLQCFFAGISLPLLRKINEKAVTSVFALEKSKDHELAIFHFAGLSVTQTFELYQNLPKFADIQIGNIIPHIPKPNSFFQEFVPCPFKKYKTSWYNHVLLSYPGESQFYICDWFESGLQVLSAQVESQYFDWFLKEKEVGDILPTWDKVGAVIFEGKQIYGVNAGGPTRFAALVGDQYRYLGSFEKTPEGSAKLANVLTQFIFN